MLLEKFSEKRSRVGGGGEREGREFVISQVIPN